MSNETKSPASESEERKIAPQTGELDAENSTRSWAALAALAAV